MDRPSRKIPRVVVLCAGAVVLLFLAQFLRIAVFVSKGIYELKPYQQYKAEAPLKILCLGDSTGVGTGVDDNRQSIAGLFGRDFPQASIVNDSYNGRRLGHLVKEFRLKPREHYNLVLIQIGGNDILKFTAYSDVRRDLAAVLQSASQAADHVVILHTGDVGRAKVFIWPFTWLMTQRTLKVRDIYIEESARAGAVYIDLYRNLKNDPVILSASYYGPDRLHLSSVGYRIWYDQIRLGLEKAGIQL